MRMFRVVIMALLLSFIWIAGGAEYSEAAQDRSLPKAAFVREGSLWVKTGAEEKLLDKGPAVQNPSWSFDGKWIAYTKGADEPELWVRELGSAVSTLVHSAGGARFQWSPHDEKLAYLIDGQLNYINAKQPNVVLGTAAGIGNFSWLPSGKGFFASSQSELLPDGWTPITLYEIPLEALGKPADYVTVHVLPKPSDDFFAVGTSMFKWSADRRWIAFLAKPTASLSADSNTLCAVSADGVVFRTLDEMVNHEQWFEWSPRGDQLAYIAGVGREATSNKQLKVVAVSSERTAAYTPRRFVDGDFAWQNSAHIVVSRAKERKDGELAPANPVYPHLVNIELASGKQKQLTKPSKKHGEYNPSTLNDSLAWVNADQTTANVVLADEHGRHAAIWIRKIDIAPSYYGQWSWSSVVSFYVHPQTQAVGR
ncbi:translocation protein TolB [Paenibacillus sinopodophylli]|uniref:translocation protein TolB n=1 Tax=Paenibacillus sinopodophylli TaxID=1837342 RepID=UPI00110D1AAB|nr:translocation protein TolB [Paenibacillus sinopodophylli]